MEHFDRQNKKKVIWFTNIPSPYRVDFFEQLGKRINLTVVFEKAASDERDSSWKNYSFNNFTGIILNGKKIATDKAFDKKIFDYLKQTDKYDYIIISNPMTVSGVISVHYLRRHNLPFIIETDGGFPGDGNGVIEKVKKYVISSAKYLFSTSDIHDKYYIKYGATKEQIFRYPFSSISVTNIVSEKQLFEEKLRAKSKLELTNKKVIISVAQFIPRKGIDLLLKSAINFSDDVVYLILGGEPTIEYQQIIKQNNLSNIIFPGFISKSEIELYYFAADIFILPTREDIWGLVINEAMAYGLPIITTDKCLAGVELIENGVNGFVIPTENVDEITNKTRSLLSHKDLINKIFKNNILKAKEYTIEKMVDWHEEFFKNKRE